MAFTSCLGISLVVSCQLYRFVAKVGHDFRQYDLNESLIIAAMDGDNRKVTTLVRHGASLRFSDNFTAFEAAVGQNNLNTVKLLVKLGAKVDDGRDGFDTPLMSAYDTSMAAYLLDHGARIDARDSSGMTALMRAAQLGNVELVQFLILRGADVNATSTDSKTALGLALESARGNGSQYQATIAALRHTGASKSAT